jgi:hypothetical protein
LTAMLVTSHQQQPLREFIAGIARVRLLSPA